MLRGVFLVSSIFLGGYTIFLAYALWLGRKNIFKDLQTEYQGAKDRGVRFARIATGLNFIAYLPVTLWSAVSRRLDLGHSFADGIVVLLLITPFALVLSPIFWVTMALHKLFDKNYQH